LVKHLHRRGALALFHYLLGVEKIDEDAKIIERDAVRAVIVRDGKILLIYSNLGYYKFPGGGVEGNETDSEALLREITEETGYVNCTVQGPLGMVLQRHVDVFDPHAFFQMTSKYFRCDLLSDEKIGQQLDDYEEEEEFTPKWVVIEEAIRVNEAKIRQLEDSWFLQRENYVLRQLVEE
jgi:8-oxo-dGTP pyrophosphatase MutT (NUDIX family)